MSGPVTITVRVSPWRVAVARALYPVTPRRFVGALLRWVSSSIAVIR